MSKSNSKSFKWLTVLKDSFRELIEIESALKIRLNWLRDFAKSYMRLTSSIYKWIGYAWFEIFWPRGTFNRHIQSQGNSY